MGKVVGKDADCHLWAVGGLGACHEPVSWQVAALEDTETETRDTETGTQDTETGTRDTECLRS